MTDHSVPTATTSRPKVIVERTYRARVEELWDLWTTKDGFESWWGPEGFHVAIHTLDARDGGALHYDMIADAAADQGDHQDSHETRGRFSEFKPYQRLALTHLIDFLPGVPPYDSTILVEFFPSGPYVRMVVTLDAMHNDAVSQMQAQGFASQLTKLDQRFR